MFRLLRFNIIVTRDNEAVAFCNNEDVYLTTVRHFECVRIFDGRMAKST